MARCQCAGSSCSCQLVASGGLTITGSGTMNSPYRIDGSVQYAGIDSNEFSGSIIDLGTLGLNLGNRVVVRLYLRHDVQINLPGGIPGLEIDLIVHHLADPGQPQWTVSIDGGIMYVMEGPALPGPDASKPTWYHCVASDTTDWFVQPRLAVTTP